MIESMLTKDIIKIAKSLKRNIVEITPYYICGSDLTTSSFSITYLNGNVEVSPELYYFGETKYLTKYDEYLSIASNFELLYKNKINYLRNQAQLIDSLPVYASAKCVNTDQDYFIDNLVRSMSLKAKEGSIMTNLEDSNMFMSSCGTMHPVNKSDIMDIRIHLFDEISFVARFTVKKKGYYINEYLRFLYIQI